MGEKELIIVEEILSLMTQAVEQYVKNFDIDDIDEYLNVRDKKPFDENWINANEEVKTHIDKNDLTFQTQEKNLRELIFKKVAKQTKHYELAGYISDDAGLIFANLYFHVNNEFANGLLESYKNGNLPY